jgi:hypothetical protein
VLHQTVLASSSLIEQLSSLFCIKSWSFPQQHSRDQPYASCSSGEPVPSLLTSIAIAPLLWVSLTPSLSSSFLAICLLRLHSCFHVSIHSFGQLAIPSFTKEVLTGSLSFISEVIQAVSASFL